MIRTKKRLRLCVVLLVLNLAFIWGNSLLPGNISQALSDFIKELLDIAVTGQGGTGEGSGLLRKIAHFLEFTSLGALLAWLCAMLGKGFPQAFLLGLAAACIDETLQFLSPGRAPGIRDVCIDAGGVAAGIILLHIGYAYFKRKNNQRSFGGNRI